MTPAARAQTELEGAFKTRGEPFATSGTFAIDDDVLVVADHHWFKGRAFAVHADIGLPNFRAHFRRGEAPFSPGCPASLLEAIDDPWAGIGDVSFGLVDGVLYLLVVDYRRDDVDRVQRYVEKAHRSVTEWLRDAPRHWITTMYVPLPLNVAVEQQLSWLAPVTGRQGDALVARFALEGHEGEMRWSDDGTHFSAGLPLADVRASLLPEEHGLRGAWKRRGEARVGLEALDDDWVIHAEPEAFAMLRAHAADLAVLRRYGAHVRFLPYELQVDAQGSWLIEEPALLWRKLVLSRLGVSV